MSKHFSKSQKDFKKAKRRTSKIFITGDIGQIDFYLIRWFKTGDIGQIDLYLLRWFKTGDIGQIDFYL